MRQLRRFAVTENAKAGIVLDWGNDDQEKYCIGYNHEYNVLEIDVIYIFQRVGSIYFATKEIAQKAISEFKSELLWYFTEYKNYFVEELV